VINDGTRLNDDNGSLAAVVVLLDSADHQAGPREEGNLHCSHSEDFIDFATANSDSVPNPQVSVASGKQIRRISMFRRERLHSRVSPSREIPGD
jgi:hypothetical protein